MRRSKPNMIVNIVVYTCAAFFLLMLVGWGMAVADGSYENTGHAVAGFVFFSLPLLLLLASRFRRGS